MGSADLINLYLEHLRALGRPTRAIESALRSIDQSLPYGLDVACRDEIIALFGSQDWKQGTRAQYRSRVGVFYNWAVRTGRLDFDPVADLETPRVRRTRPKPWTEHELWTICEQSSGWLLLAVVLAAWAGLRCCEIALLCGEDVTDTELTVWRGKGGKSRVVPTHPRVWRAVADLPPGNLMLATGGRPEADWVSRTSWNRLMRMGIKPSGLHRGRHRFASRMLAEGASTRYVQEALGHASLESTQVYTEVTQPDLARWVSALPDVGPAGPSDHPARRGRRTGSGGVGPAEPAAASSADISP